MLRHKNTRTASRHDSMRSHHGTGSYTLLYISTVPDSKRR